MAIIYLAGGMKDGWQDTLIPALEADGHIIKDPRSWGGDDPAIYTPRDLYEIRNCDIVLAHMSSSNPSGFGMSVELGFAYGIYVPVIFLDDIQTDWRSRYFGMHRVMAHEVCCGLGEVIGAIRRLGK